MSDYMRKVFYVRKREENPDCSVTAGYVKAERRKQVLTLTIFLDTQDLPEECPVCAAQAESGSVSPADGSLLIKTELPSVTCFCRTMRQLPTRMLWQESELAEMALTGQDNCRAFMNVRQGSSAGA